MNDEAIYEADLGLWRVANARAIALSLTSCSKSTKVAPPQKVATKNNLKTPTTVAAISLEQIFDPDYAVEGKKIIKYFNKSNNKVE